MNRMFPLVVAGFGLGCAFSALLVFVSMQLIKSVRSGRERSRAQSQD